MINAINISARRTYIKRRVTQRNEQQARFYYVCVTAAAFTWADGKKARAPHTDDDVLTEQTGANLCSLQLYIKVQERARRRNFIITHIYMRIPANIGAESSHTHLYAVGSCYYSNDRKLSRSMFANDVIAKQYWSGLFALAYANIWIVSFFEHRCRLLLC